jgi:signal transduction histidine kinase
MIGNIAHQWRQPLSVISTAASGSLLEKQYDILTDEKFEKNMNQILENTEYLSQTIDDFKNFIKGETKKEKFLTCEMQYKVINLVSPVLKDNFIVLKDTLHIKTQMYGSLNMLVQVLVNIINNAKDILVEKDIDNRVIFFDISKKDESIIITIQDNGGGVPEDILHKIFDAYFTTKHQSVGTGLGLHMAYNIITTNFNGIIEVKNVSFEYKEHEYTGAKFIITLPLSEM